MVPMKFGGCVMIVLVMFCSWTTSRAAPLTEGIVKSWSEKVEQYLLKLAEEGLKAKELQQYYDNAVYTVEDKKGSETVSSVKSRLGNYFVKKEQAARVSILRIY
jgi:hypothetical protein